MTNAGTLRDRITIITSGPTVENAFGRKPAGPDTVMEIWAALQQLQAKTFFEDGKFYSKQPYRITLRYDSAPGLTVADRVEWNGLRISIASIVTDPKKTTTTIYGFGN
jgi:SPP1 family predicted phage head-tail adaptor